MKYTRLGRTNLKVSRIGLGGIPLQRPTEEESIKIIQYAINRGINLLDTSRGYGTSEERIGKAIKGYREDIILITRSWVVEKEIAAEHIETSLKTLNTDYIDIWQFHDIDMDKYQTIMAEGGTLDVARKAQAEGKVIHIGLTSHDINVMKLAISSDIFEVVLFPFNFINSAAETELLKLAEKYDVGFIAMKPFAGGRITNTKLALKYLLQFENVIPIPGVQHVDEVEKNITVLESHSKLNKKDRKEIRNTRKQLGYRFCQWCGYCETVCPQKIPISRIINIKVSWNLWPTDTFIEERKDHINSAEECIDCGACEEMCPYKIPIRKLMKEAVSFYYALV